MQVCIETVREARAILSGKLIFGEDRQIRAVRFLEAVETAKELIESCPQCHLRQEYCMECSGTGRHECDCGDEHDCHECDGKGMDNIGTSVFECDCCGMYSREVIGEAWRAMR